MRKFLWQGGLRTGMVKVVWSDVCRPLEEGGQGIRVLHPLNKGLMCKHLWDVLQHNNESIWVTWIYQYRLKQLTVWTANPNTGSWSWHTLPPQEGADRICWRGSNDFTSREAYHLFQPARPKSHTELLETVLFYGLPSWRGFPRLITLSGRVRIGLVCSVPEGLLRHMIMYSFNAITLGSACRYFALRCISPYHLGLGDRTWIGLPDVGGVGIP
ncbi:UNVERIFIED_CONTAM: hypothetical protein Sradi_6207900 [Sesamum radiatum]|uniref:Uncharacterized protein n=1 Tax=Sesamum radiatum TaxID=300843 RepID=A0AAW2KC14_SESRA